MADFHQNGIITTLHNLTDRPLSVMENELTAFSKKRPMTLILPCLYSELAGPALSNIIDQLADIPYLHEIVVGLDRANEEQFRHAIEFFSRLPQRHRILWNDGPRLQAVHKLLQAQHLAPRQLGKGCNVWYCMGYVLSSERSKAVALHDCDILTYDRNLLARLFYPVANPQFNFAFCKGFYSRIADGKMNGRVSRLLVSPLLLSLKKILGPNDYIEYMHSYRYPLSGEFSMSTDVLYEIRIPSDWGLEIGVLSEMFRKYAGNRICQVDIADVYDHKHQDLSANNDKTGLAKMSIDISEAIFRKLATNGIVLSAETFRTIKATYFRIALDFIEIYHSDAIINGLDLDVHQEEIAVELFAENIMKAGTHFLDKPMATPFMPSWNRIISANPKILDEINSAVENDKQEYSA